MVSIKLLTTKKKYLLLIQINFNLFKMAAIFINIITVVVAAAIINTIFIMVKVKKHYNNYY